MPPTVANEAQGNVDSKAWLGMLEGFSEKVFNACPHIFDECLHIFVVAHASHVHHIRTEMLRLRVVINVSETSCINYVSNVDGG